MSAKRKSTYNELTNMQEFKSSQQLDHPQLPAVAHFLGDYAGHLLGCGVHTSRVVRNSKRIAESFNMDVTVTTLMRTMTVSVKPKNLVKDEDGKESAYTIVLDVPTGPILFAHNANLSALSWDALDQKLSLDVLRERFEKIKALPLINPWVILLLASLANMSFCKLFGGGAIAMGIVFIATAIGFRCRQLMIKWKLNHYMVFILSAFIASMLCASSFTITPADSEIVMITSVLYLIPGVPLVNGVVDIIEGFTLVGVARLIKALLLILSLAVGLGATLMIFKNSLL